MHTLCRETLKTAAQQLEMAIDNLLDAAEYANEAETLHIWAAKGLVERASSKLDRLLQAAKDQP